jgi:hypothetical protein
VSVKLSLCNGSEEVGGGSSAEKNDCLAIDVSAIGCPGKSLIEGNLEYFDVFTFFINAAAGRCPIVWAVGCGVKVEALRDGAGARVEVENVLSSPTFTPSSSLASRRMAASGASSSSRPAAVSMSIPSGCSLT